MSSSVLKADGWGIWTIKGKEEWGSTSYNATAADEAYLARQRNS